MQRRESKSVGLLACGLVLASCAVVIGLSLQGETQRNAALDQPVPKTAAEELVSVGRQSPDPRLEPGSIRPGSASPTSASPAQARERAVEPEQAPDPGPNVALHGQVIDAITGAAVRSFRVFVQPTGAGSILEEATLNPTGGVLRHDLEGRFHFDDLAEGSYSVLIDPTASGHEQTVSHDIEVPRAQPLVLHVGRGAHVEGRLLDLHDRPVPHVEVVLEGTDIGGAETTTYSDRQTTDREGCFLFTKVPVGEYRLSSACSDKDRVATFRVREHARVEKNLLLPTANALEFVVIDPEGKPIRGATILLASHAGQRRRALTDEHGEARVCALPASRHAVRTSLAGFRVNNQSVDMSVVGDRCVRIELTRAVK